MIREYLRIVDRLPFPAAVAVSIYGGLGLGEGVLGVSGSYGLAWLPAFITGMLACAVSPAGTIGRYLYLRWKQRR
jgi:hypothetical protein